MSNLSRTIRVGSAGAATMAALLLSAAPGFAQSEAPPGSGGTTTTTHHETSSGTDWTAVGSGAAGGIALAGSAVAMASVLRRRQRHTALQA
jgi:hypothetical protein